MPRLLELVLAGVLLALLGPVVAACALLVRCDLGRPVVFRQIRAGLPPPDGVGEASLVVKANPIGMVLALGRSGWQRPFVLDPNASGPYRAACDTPWARRPSCSSWVKTGTLAAMSTGSSSDGRRMASQPMIYA